MSTDPGTPAPSDRSPSTRPNSHKPPQQLFDRALLQLAALFNDIATVARGTAGGRTVPYALLRRRLEEAGHSRAGAEWAIHEHAAAGRLLVEPGGVELGVFTPWESSYSVKGTSPNRDQARLRDTPSLWRWWDEIGGRSEIARPATPSEPTGEDRAGVARPPAHPASGEPLVTAPPVPVAIPLGELIRRLDQLEKDESNPGPYIRRLDGKPTDEWSNQHGRMMYFAMVAQQRAAIESSPGYAELRAYCLREWGEEPSAAVCRRVIRGLLSAPHNMGLAEAEQLTADEAARRLGVAAPPRPPAQPGVREVQWERLFDNDLSPFRIMAAFANQLGSAYRTWARGGEPLSDRDRMTIYIRWQEAREAALRLAGKAGLALDVADRDVRSADAAFTALHQALSNGLRTADTGAVDSASVRLYDLGLLTEEA